MCIDSKAISKTHSWNVSWVFFKRIWREKEKSSLPREGEQRGRRTDIWDGAAIILQDISLKGEREPTGFAILRLSRVLGARKRVNNEDLGKDLIKTPTGYSHSAAHNQMDPTGTDPLRFLFSGGFSCKNFIPLWLIRTIVECSRLESHKWLKLS